MINYEERLSAEERDVAMYIISKMQIENKPTINELMNEVRDIALSHGLIEDNKAASRTAMEGDIA